MTREMSTMSINTDSTTEPDTMANPSQRTCLSMKSYIVVNSIILFAFLVYFSCFSAVLGPISKQFHFTDTQLGVINTADDIGRITFVLIVSYFGIRWHVPRVLGVTGCIYSVIAVSITVPYFIFKHGKGPDDIFGESMPHLNGSNAIFNHSDVPGGKEAIAEMAFADSVAYYVFLTSYVLLGIVGSPWGSLQIWYIDENADKSKFPLLIGILKSVRMVGHIIGTYLAAAVNRIYVDLTSTDLSPKDPTFIGAWWLGLLIAAALCILASPLFCFFPRTMKTDKDIKAFLDEASSKESTQRLSKKYALPKETLLLADETPSERRARFFNLMNDIYRAKNAPHLIISLLKNPVYIMLILVQVAWRYSWSIFGVKYFTIQFSLADWEASAILGTGATIGSVCRALGIFLGGLVVYRLKPTFSQVTLGCGVVSIILAMLTFVDMLIGCDNFEMYGMATDDENVGLHTACNLQFSCNTFAYKPVCDNGITYFSPCHAGCTGVTVNETKTFSECACTASGLATHGACPKTCSSYYIYVAIDILKSMFAGSAISAVILIQIRCVDSTEKALSFGLRMFFAKLLGIPVALLYGSVMDSACLVWQETFREGNSRGVCWVYDYKIFRERYWGVSLGFRILSVALLFAISFYTRKKNIRMYDVDVSLCDRNGRTSSTGGMEKNECAI